MTLQYPKAERSNHIDTYTNAAGQQRQVADPYRWLEDPNSPETKAWIDAQIEVTDQFLEGLKSREAYRKRMTELWDYPKDGVPWKKGGRYFRMYNTGLQNQDVLQVSENAKGPWRDLLDPNTLSEDGTIALMGTSVTKNGNKLAYGLQSAGSDWITWHVLDIETGQKLEDVLEWSKFGGATWLPDGSGLYYTAYDAPKEGDSYTGANTNQRLMLHKLGTPQSEDQEIISRPDEPQWGFAASITHDEKYLVIEVWVGGPKNLLWIRSLDSDGPFTELISEFDAEYSFMASQGDDFYILTDKDAPRKKLIKWNIQTNAQQDLIPENEHALQYALLTPHGFLVVQMVDASHRLSLYDLEGNKVQDIQLPTYGSLGLSTKQDDPEVFLVFTSFLFPNTPYQLHLPSGELEPLAKPALNFDTDSYTVTQEFAISKDGTRVPMFIVAHKDAPRDGSKKALLYGYGGFTVSLTPTFSNTRLAWLERGGVLVVANLRGGGEYGEEWHKAGTKKQKQNVFDDFIACAEYLIKEGWTTSNNLAIQGGSNGGLLVGACMTQRPDLFAVAVPQVGVLDMLRYHEFTIGWAWADDYGRSDDPEMFDTLYAYSPLHNLKADKHYPATLVTTADHDDRVVPAHSFKFAAELQHVHTGPNPTLIRIQTQAGHGAGKPTSMIINEHADVFAFMEEMTGR